MIFSIYQTAVLLWMHDPVGRDAIIPRQALTGTKNLEAATEVLCSRTPSQIQSFKQIYHSKFGVPLEHDIERNTSGDHKMVTFLYVSQFNQGLTIMFWRLISLLPCLNLTLS